jgi:hypothetical protein
LGGKEVGGLLVIILHFKKRKTETKRAGEYAGGRKIGLEMVNIVLSVSGSSALALIFMLSYQNLACISVFPIYTT